MPWKINLLFLGFTALWLCLLGLNKSWSITLATPLLEGQHSFQMCFAVLAFTFLKPKETCLKTVILTGANPFWLAWILQGGVWYFDTWNFCSLSSRLNHSSAWFWTPQRKAWFLTRLPQQKPCWWSAFRRLFLWLCWLADALHLGSSSCPVFRNHDSFVSKLSPWDWVAPVTGSPILSARQPQSRTPPTRLYLSCITYLLLLTAQWHIPCAVLWLQLSRNS